MIGKQAFHECPPTVNELIVQATGVALIVFNVVQRRCIGSLLYITNKSCGYCKEKNSSRISPTIINIIKSEDTTLSKVRTQHYQKLGHKIIKNEAPK